METEVYRMTRFEKDKSYETVNFTRRQGTRYFTSLPTRFVGTWLRTERNGYGDGGRIWEIFSKNGQEERVEYNYEGTTCFVESDVSMSYVLK